MQQGICESLKAFKDVTNYFVDHLPEDLVTYWDSVFTEGDEPRDSSELFFGTHSMYLL